MRSRVSPVVQSTIYRLFSLIHLSCMCILIHLAYQYSDAHYFVLTALIYCTRLCNLALSLLCNMQCVPDEEAAEDWMYLLEFLRASQYMYNVIRVFDWPWYSKVWCGRYARELDGDYCHNYHYTVFHYDCIQSLCLLFPLSLNNFWRLPSYYRQIVRDWV